ncbi:exodeoxyribonuclease VII large subunit [Candidatus Gottesmanbacteria bacterium]|nr:exodeoxyribonuclease VII large subunit [Candidatus Gottesmanbacteria bacterium]
MKDNSQFLYELLREKRNKLARDTNVKPYMIFHNKVLQAISETKPVTLEELGKIKGMGEKKLAKYGSLILETINGREDEETIKETSEKVFTVYEYITHLNQILTQQVAVILGEITSVDDRGNYLFFTIHDKNEEASLKCFILENTLNGLGVELRQGLEVKISGFPKIYGKWGSLSFEVEYIGLVGEGALKLAFEKLKKRLQKEGYFDENRKKKIADYVETIGLITSRFGDAQNDFLTHLGKYGFKILFYDVRVEGLYALDDITSAIRWFNENLIDIDVLVITRGGGGLEKLQPFNSETIAKAIFSSKIPVITGIGHENDTTIADLVSDLRASTPTDAARILSDPWRNVVNLLNQTAKTITSIFSRNFKDNFLRIANYEENIVTASDKILKSREQKLSNLQLILGSQFEGLIHQVKQIQTAFFNNWERLRSNFFTIRNEIITQEKILFHEIDRRFRTISINLQNLEQKLHLGNPTIRLKQGYSIITNIDRRVIKSNKQIKVGDSLNLKFYQGRASSKVEDIEE